MKEEKEKNPHASALASIRWAKTTAEERTEYCRRIASLPRKKRKGVAKMEKINYKK